MSCTLLFVEANTIHNWQGRNRPCTGDTQLSALNTLHALLVVCDHQPLQPSCPTHRARCPARGKHMPHNYAYRHSKLHRYPTNPTLLLLTMCVVKIYTKCTAKHQTNPSEYMYCTSYNCKTLGYQLYIIYTYTNNWLIIKIVSKIVTIIERPVKQYMLTNDDMEYRVLAHNKDASTPVIYFCTLFHYTHIVISDVTSNGLYLTIGNIVDWHKTDDSFNKRHIGILSDRQFGSQMIPRTASLCNAGMKVHTQNYFILRHSLPVADCQATGFTFIQGFSLTYQTNSLSQLIHSLEATLLTARDSLKWRRGEGGKTLVTPATMVINSNGVHFEGFMFVNMH